MLIAKKFDVFDLIKKNGYNFRKRNLYPYVLLKLPS